MKEKSLHQKYREERDGLIFYEDEKVYFSYKIIDEYHIYVHEIFISENHRTFFSFNFVENYLKKNHDIKFISGTVVPRSPHSEEALFILLHCKFKIWKTDSEKIYLTKEV